MTREDKRALKGHFGRLVLLLSAEHGYTGVVRFDTLHLTRSTFVPRKDGMVDMRGKMQTIYDVDGCGEFDSLSDAVFVLKTTGRLSPLHPK